MTVVATAELEGSSNVSGAWSADLEKARTRVDEFGKQANKSLGDAGGAGETAMGQINGLAASAQALMGTAVVAGAVRLGTELFTIGGEAQEARVNLDALSGGQLDAYMNAVNTGADGMISRLAEMQITSSALNFGLKLNAQQMGELAQASTVFADVMHTDAKTAYETMTDAIGKGNARMLQQLGIVSKGKDMQAEINKQLNENSGLTYTQASQLAAYNLVLERRNELMAEGVGATSSASDAQERFSAGIENAKTDVGEWLANGLMPWIDGARGVNQAIEEQSHHLLLASNSAWEYNQEIQKLNLQTGRMQTTGVMTEEQFAREKAPILTGGEASKHEQAQGIIDARQAANAQNFTTTVDQLNSSFARVSATLQRYADSVEQQAKVEIQSVQTAQTLTSGHAKMSDVFSAGMSQLQGYTLTTQQQRDAYEALGLVTGEVTTKQIDQGNSLREISNLAAAGDITWLQYADTMKQVAQGADAAALATKSQQQAVAAAMSEAAKSGGGVGEARAQAPTTVAQDASGMKASLEEAKSQLAQYQQLLGQASGAVTTEFQTNLDAGAMDKLNNYVTLLSKAQGSVVTEFESQFKNEDATRAYGNLLGGIAGYGTGGINTVLTTTASKETPKVQGLVDAIAKLGNKTVTIKVNYVQTGQTPVGYQPPS